MDPLESSSSGWWALRGYPAYWTCQEQTKATAQLHTGHVVVPVRLYLSAVPFPDLIWMIYPSSACSRGLDWLLCASQQDEQMCWCPVQRAVLLSPSPFCFPLQAKVEASGHVSTRTWRFKHHPACSLPWQCLPWRRTGFQVHVLLLGLIKLPQVPLGNRIPQVYLNGVFFLFFFFFSVIPRTNKMSFSAYLHTDTEQGLIMFPYHCPSLISCVWTEL